MKKLLLILLFVPLLFTTCKKEEEENMLSYSTGWWQGTSFNATIDSDGNVSGFDLWSNALSGNVTNNGSFSANVGGSSGTNYIGTLNGYDGIGTWDSSGITGTWELGCKDGCTGNFE